MLDQHFDYESLLAFAAGEISSDGGQDIAPHIEICAECSKVVRRFRLISSAMQSDDSREPPPATIARAQAIFARHRPARASLRQRINFPRLSLSLLQFSRAGVLILFVLANFMLCSGLGAVTVSAQSTIPGDVLYPVKLNLESIQLATTWDTGDRVERQLEFADSRSKEIVALVAFERSAEIPSTLASFEKHVDLVVQTFELLAKQNFQRAQLLAPGIENAMVRQTNRLGNLREDAGEAARPALERAIAFSAARRAVVSAISGQPPAPTQVPSPQPSRLVEPSSTAAITQSEPPPTQPGLPSPSVAPVVVSTPTLVLTPTPPQPVKAQTSTKIVETPVVTSTITITISTPHADKTPPGLDKDKDKDKDPPGQDKDRDKEPPGQQKDPPTRVK